jgi:hypothetical protein
MASPHVRELSLSRHLQRQTGIAPLPETAPLAAESSWAIDDICKHRGSPTLR